MPTKIYIRRGTDTERQTTILDEGEPGYTTDTKKLYIGDGVTSGGIFVGGSGIGIDSLNSLIGDVTVVGGQGIVVSVSGQSLVVDEEAGGLDVDSINGLTGVVTISGTGLVTVTLSGQDILVGATASFLDLTDSPSSYSGEGGKIVIVKATEDGLEFGTSASGLVSSVNTLNQDITISGIGATVVSISGQYILIQGGGGSFTDLDDAPSDYAGYGNHILAVNAGENALEFVKAVTLRHDLSNEDYSGIVTSGIAGQTLLFGDVVQYTSGKWSRTDNTAESTSIGQLGLVVQSGSLDDDITLLLIGYARDDTWSYNATTSGLWLSTTGAMTETIPDTLNSIVRHVGYAKSTGVIWFNPDDMYIELLDTPSGYTQFTVLEDTPDSYAGQENKIVSVNAGGTALEFATSFIMTNSLSGDETYAGIVTSGVASETLAFGDLAMYNNDSKWIKADKSEETKVDGQIGVVVVSGATDESISLLLMGYARDNDWSYVTASSVYVGTSGVMSQTLPTTSGDFVRTVGYAISPNIIFFNPDNNIIELGTP